LQKNCHSSRPLRAMKEYWREKKLLLGDSLLQLLHFCKSDHFPERESVISELQTLS
jgi:hypothetical protein